MTPITANESDDEHRDGPTDVDYRFFASTGAKLLCHPPLGWLLFRRYYLAYRDAVQRDLWAFSSLQVDRVELDRVKRRAKAAIQTVGACSARYKISDLILRSGFWAGIACALIAILIGGGGVFADLAATAVAMGLLCTFAYASLKLSTGLRFDAFWFLGWAAFSWFLVARPEATLGTLNRWSVSPIWASALTKTVYGIAVYASVIVLATIIGRTVYTATTNRKRQYPEEEIIQTLIVTLSYVEKNRAAWAQPRVRRAVARQLDWIANRFEFDFFRRYPRSDAATASWSQKKSLETAGVIRVLKQEALLPSPTSFEHLHEQIGTMLLRSAGGDWAALPTIEGAGPSVTEKGWAINALQATLWIVVLLAIAALANWKLHDPLKASVTTALLGLSCVNLLASLNPGGFDKQIAAAKTVSDAIRKSA